MVKKNFSILLYIFQTNVLVETLEQQFTLVRKETNTSHVLQFGDLVRFKFFLICSIEYFTLNTKGL